MLRQLTTERGGLDTSAHRRRFGCFVCLALVSGCSQFIDPNVPEPIRPFVEPERGSGYLLYKPSSYDAKFAWPLIIVCHDRRPDSANKRIRAWSRLAEAQGFIVAAPTLGVTDRFFAAGKDRQLALQREDERRIFAVMRHVRAAHNISADRIFIHGLAAAAPVALAAGLRHPDVIRAIAVAQPKFDERWMIDVRGKVDRHQPVFVGYDIADAVTGRDAERCGQWLRERGVNLTKGTIGALSAGDAQGPVEFFQRVIRTQPWIRIRALPAPGNDPLAVQFKLACSFRPTSYRWDLGDGHDSTAPMPQHTYAVRNKYRVRVTVVDPDGKEHHRTATVSVPEVTLGPGDPLPQTD